MNTLLMRKGKNLTSQDVKVSIVTVCYNSETTIEKTIESVINQTYANIEYIIVDGGSTDETLTIINKYSQRYNGRIKYISERDEGIYDAMNKGIKMTTGQLIGIINSDDYYELDAVEHIVSAWNGSGMQILYGLMRKLINGKEDSVLLLSHESLEDRMICHPSCFVTADVYREIGTFEKKYQSVADYDFMLRAFRSGKVFFKPVYNILANFNSGGVSGSLSGYRENLEYLRKQGKISSFKMLLLLLYVRMKRTIFNGIGNRYEGKV